MNNTPKFANILFRLPDGRIVLQRRTKDAPYGAGLLGIFGGWVEEGEDINECLVREIKEETSLDPQKLDIKFMTDFVIPASQDFDKDRHFYLYQGNVENLHFEVYEGDGAEAFTIAELQGRSDLTASTRYTFDMLFARPTN